MRKRNEIYIHNSENQTQPLKTKNTTQKHRLQLDVRVCVWRGVS